VDVPEDDERSRKESPRHFPNQKMTRKSTGSVRNLSEMIAGISKVSGEAIPKIVDHEMGKILEKSASLTPLATESKIVANALMREWGNHKTSFQPKARFKGEIIGDGFKRYKYSNRYPGALWDHISDQRLASIQRRMESIGISKQSWFRVAEMLGLKIEVPKKVSKIPKGPNSNFETSRTTGSGEYSVSFKNAQPTINRIGGRRILKQAVAGRVRFFEKNTEKGVLDDLAAFAKAYPGLTVRAPGGQLE